MNASVRRQRGVNIIELIIAIVIISIAVVGLMQVYAQAVRFSADPMIEHQAGAIAEGYLDEILARDYLDPSGGETGGSEEGNPSLAVVRPLLDDVQDYNGLSNTPPQDSLGTVADLDADGQADLAGYSVDVSVTPGVIVDGVTMAQVDVRVRFSAVADIVLTGYRAQY